MQSYSWSTSTDGMLIHTILFMFMVTHHRIEDALTRYFTILLIICFIFIYFSSVLFHYYGWFMSFSCSCGGRLLSPLPLLFPPRCSFSHCRCYRLLVYCSHHLPSLLLPPPSPPFVASACLPHLQWSPPPLLNLYLLPPPLALHSLLLKLSANTTCPPIM